MRRIFPYSLLLLLFPFLLLPSHPSVESRGAPVVIGPTDFGLAFINSAEAPRSEARIRRGVETGAKMDRFPLYWDKIEHSPGLFDWSRHDAVLQANENQGLGTLAILLGTPGHYYPSTATEQSPQAMDELGGGPLRFEEGATGTSSCTGTPPPRNLGEPIFADGSDEPAPGKQVNGNNHWARYVYEAVNRYRPGGPVGLNVRYWQIWNEPDLCHFWGGTPAEYARLLKVAYLVIKQVDPQATVLWGGLAHYGPKYEAPRHFLNEFVEALKNDPMAAAHNGFFDAAASHQYSNITNGYHYTLRIRRALAGTGWESKPIWVTESGVPVCGDYPGPSCPSPHRADEVGQASFIWQNIAMSRIAGNNGPIFHFQLHDDCGNVVSPTSPDAFGLRKNDSNSFCSPANAEPRLSYTTYKLAARYLSGVELLWHDVQEGARRVGFHHPGANERRILVWATGAEEVLARVPAIAGSARLIAIDGTESTIYPVNGEYEIPLPGSTNMPVPGSATYVGGKPYLLIEGNVPAPIVQVTGQLLNRQGKPAQHGFVGIGNAGAFTGAQGEFQLQVRQGHWNIAVQDTIQRYGYLFTQDLNLQLVLPPMDEAIRNGDFERSLSEWSQGGSSPRSLEQLPNLRDHAVRLAAEFTPSPGVPGTDGSGGGNSTIMQQVRVPTGQPYLTLVYKVESEEPVSPESSCLSPDQIFKDKFEIIVHARDASGEVQRYDLHCQEVASEWQFLFLDMSEFAGQEVNLIFNVYESSGERRTSALVDLVSLGNGPTLAPPEQIYLPVLVR